ncbi:MAG TPA: hypothetical protein VMD03_10955 [Steroidobacteraceae bacterium]|nr:hypothetical protein [Steroidobacteraceae bacterium]
MRPNFPLLIAAATLASAGCGGNAKVSLAQLAESEQVYAGQRVLTRGVVRDERDPDGSTYFVLADPRGTLVGLEPAAKAIRFEGRLVQVSGLFEVQPGFGRLIHIATIAPAKSDGD